VGGVCRAWFWAGVCRAWLWAGVCLDDVIFSVLFAQPLIARPCHIPLFPPIFPFGPQVLISGFGRKGHAVGDIPGVRFKVRPPVHSLPTVPRQLARPVSVRVRQQILLWYTGRYTSISVARRTALFTLHAALVGQPANAVVSPATHTHAHARPVCAGRQGSQRVASRPLQGEEGQAPVLKRPGTATIIPLSDE